MRSKAFHTFNIRVNYFDDDLDLVDVLRTCVLAGDLSSDESKQLLDRLDPLKYKHLARRRNKNGSRKNCMNHLRATVYAAYLKDLYEEVTEYLRTILFQASANGFSGRRIIGEHSFKMNAQDVLQLGTWENVCRSVTDSLFQCLESEKSTLTLLKKVSIKLDLNVDENMMKDALPYLELRHFLIHTDGDLPVDYIAKYPHIPRKSRTSSVALNYKLVNDARTKVMTLMQDFDTKLVAASLLPADKLGT